MDILVKITDHNLIGIMKIFVKMYENIERQLEFVYIGYINGSHLEVSEQQGIRNIF